tara:strand:- start:253 stop:597 length:345 start_codon:yes stop_codon:yes gene_type:complete
MNNNTHSVMSAAGQQVMGGFGGMSSSGSTKQVSFKGFVDNLEADINETRKELNFCKKEVQVLNTERDTVLEMAQTKCTDIDKYLHKEIAYLDDLIIKANNKQNKEYKDFWSQCS